MLSDDIWDPEPAPPPRRRRWIPSTVIGVALGKKRDPTALAVTELEPRRIKRPHGRYETQFHFVVRHLTRLPSGTAYREVAHRVSEVCSKLRQLNGSRPDIFLDVTGMGTPVAEMIKDQAHDAKWIWVVYFNHGDRREEDRDNRKVTLGKAYLVSRLQTLLQSGRLHVPETTEARALAEDLRTYEVSVDENANNRYGAFRVGRSDDVVTALGLSVQTEPRCCVYIHVPPSYHF